MNYILTDEQIEMICERFGKDKRDMEDYEICELVDKIIDEYCCQ